MKITIDPTQKTVSLEGEATIEEIINLFYDRLTKEEIKEFKITPTGTQIHYHPYYIPSPIETNPWNPIPKTGDIIYTTQTHLT
jgi:hypothetical protein